MKTILIEYRNGKVFKTSSHNSKKDAEKQVKKDTLGTIKERVKQDYENRMLQTSNGKGGK